jgi:thiosulfate reductase cytochrome b subunit
MATDSVRSRSGLPRVNGGDPWPPAIDLPRPGRRALRAESNGKGHVESAPAVEADVPTVNVGQTRPLATEAGTAGPPVPSPPSTDKASAPGPLRVTAKIRRGLPRASAGQAWPVVPEGQLRVNASPLTAQSSDPTHPTGEVASETEMFRDAPASTRSAATQQVPPEAALPVRQRLGVSTPPPQDAAPGPSSQLPETPSPATPQAQAGLKSAARSPGSPPAAAAAVPQHQAKLYGTRTATQWIRLGILSAVGAIAAAAILVLAARGVTTLPGVPQFLERYPGEYHLPETVEPGFPWWARWTHFLNIFLMVLIIRSGYQVRTQQKPPAYWTPKKGGKKISIDLWLHQGLDFIWLLNGLAFVVLLFTSGHWMRIVPSSWEVFPNALSAMLQYATLDWPVENGWVNYNSLQQIMYFLVVFVAAPLAAITGVRMSELWPKNAKALNKIYPVEVARALHFPTMLFFVFFIVVHVFLVFATGALRNLNHMYAGTDVVNWTGFFLFAASLLVIVGGWVAARPLVLAPIAKLFGQVSSR